MLVKVEEGTYLNIKNISYMIIEGKECQYTEVGNSNLKSFEFGFISKETFLTFIDNDSKFIGMNGSKDLIYVNKDLIYVNIEAITKINYSDEDSGKVRVSIWFINDENSYTFNVNDRDMLDKIINKINDQLGLEKSVYVDHF